MGCVWYCLHPMSCCCTDPHDGCPMHGTDQRPAQGPNRRGSGWHLTQNPVDYWTYSSGSRRWMSNPCREVSLAFLCRVVVASGRSSSATNSATNSVHTNSTRPGGSNELGYEMLLSPRTPGSAAGPPSRIPKVLCGWACRQGFGSLQGDGVLICLEMLSRKAFLANPCCQEMQRSAD